MSLHSLSLTGMKALGKNTFYQPGRVNLLHAATVHIPENEWIIYTCGPLSPSLCFSLYISLSLYMCGHLRVGGGGGGGGGRGGVYRVLFWERPAGFSTHFIFFFRYKLIF